MRRGDTFLIKEAGLDTHLWIITSCPLRDPSRVLCLNVTTFDSRNPSKDPACILVRTDHPFLTKDESCIHYAGAKLLSLDDLIRWKQTKLIEMREPIRCRKRSWGESTAALKRRAV